MRVSAGHAAMSALLLVPLISCGARSRSGAARRSSPPSRAQAATLAALDPAEAYRRAGFLTTAGPVSFVGSLRFLAGPSPDSVLAVVAVSFPSRSLSFTREGEQYRAAYEVEFELQQRSQGVTHTVGRFRAREMVRVSSLRETTRNEESIIFQQIVAVPPGSYTVALSVRDLGSNRSATAEAAVVAPQFAGASAGRSDAAGLATPVTVHAATPRASRTALPDLVVSARSTAVFGRDSVIRVYLEWYGISTIGPMERAPLIRFAVRSDDGRELYADSAAAGAWSGDGQIASATVRLSVTKIGLGRLRISAWRAGGSDTVSAPLFVSIAEDLAAVSFEELLGYLRYFTTAERLRALRDTTADARVAAWTSFLRVTDPSPTTPEHEGLHEYFARLAVANARFRGEDVPGWLSDRGMVYSTLGEPDRVVEPNDGEGRLRGRAQVWEYAQHHLRLIFVEQEGSRRWRLTPTSEAEFQSAVERIKR